MKIRLIATVVFILTSAIESQAQITMSSIFSDNMVIQQKSKAPVWGWAPSASHISVVGSWNQKDTISTKVLNDGSWRVNLPTSQAGGPYTLTILNQGNKKVFENVMLGEVWLCSGQSNMQWSVNHGIKDGEAEAAAATNSNIRIFQVPLYGAVTPQNTCNAQWEESTPATMRQTSAIGYFFARELQAKLGVPVGILVSAWGGSPIEAWTPACMIESNQLLRANRLKNENEWWAAQCGGMYNQMIHPLMPYKIKGSLWYQGESNQINAKTYGLALQALIMGWRNGFESNFPFYIAQIAPFKYGAKDDGPQLVREKEEMVSKLVPNTGLVVLSDLVEDVNNIHPTDKQSVASRFANMAFARDYALEVKSYKSPTFAGIEIKGDKAIISFHDVVDGLKIKGDSIVGLKIIGADGNQADATAKIDGDKLIVSAKNVKNPVAVQYCYHESQIGNLFSGAGLPVAPFRSTVKMEL